ncbi:MAG: nucleotidyltransferase family protein [Desulfobacterales bacterium]|nr:nucleotidyltransferase family protein [Desulfobacterales bacterium]
MDKKITAVVLVGGQGTRLRSVVSDKPKVLAAVKGRPFLTYLLDQLESNNITEVVFCSGYMADTIEAYFGDHYKSIIIQYSREEIPLDTGGALRLALPLLLSDTILVMNGDSFVKTDLTIFTKTFFQQKHIADMLLAKVNDVSRFGNVTFNKECEITSFKEKGEHKGPGWINAGIYLFRKKILFDIPEDCFFSLERGFFPKLIGKGLFGFCTEGDFIDIGTPDSYNKTALFFDNI